MAALTDAELTVLADIIQNEDEAGANTATRIGTFLNDLIDSKINDEDIDVASAIVTVKVSLTTAQILAGFTTPQTLVAAQGADTYINVLSIAKRMVYNSIAYTTNTTDRVYIGSFSPIITDGAILAASANDFSVTSPTQSLETSGTPDWVNAPLMWKVVTGNPAAGNSPLDLYITYNVITL